MVKDMDDRGIWGGSAQGEICVCMYVCQYVQEFIRYQISDIKDIKDRTSRNDITSKKRRGRRRRRRKRTARGSIDIDMSSVL